MTEHFFSTVFLVLALIFFIGSFSGWVLELFYRRFISAANPERKWINPGFLNGPCLPLYGFSLCALFLLSHINTSFIGNKVLAKIVLFIIMALVVTAIEFIAGEIFITRMKIKLWDYDHEWGNIKGIICPKYSFYWALLSGIYYFLIHPYIMDSIIWLSKHLAFSFVMGFYYGVLAMDFSYSFQVMAKIKKFAIDNDVIVRYETLKEVIRIKNEEFKEKRHFIFAFKSNSISLTEGLTHYLQNMVNELENIKNKGLKSK